MKHLAMPAFFYGLTLGLMEQLYDFIVMVIGFDHHGDYTSIRALAEVFAVMMMLSLRLVALFPTQITLTLAEVKLMSPEIETIIPSPSKECGLKVGELIGDQKPPAAFEAFSNFFKPLRTVMYLQLIGLHLKKCLLQIIVEIVFITVFFGAMYLELFVPDEDEDEWIVQFMEALDSYGKLE